MTGLGSSAKKQPSPPLSQGNKTNPTQFVVLYANGAPEGIRTSDLCLRRASVRKFPLLTSISLSGRSDRNMLERPYFQGNGHSGKFREMTATCLPPAYPGVLWSSSQNGLWTPNGPLRDATSSFGTTKLRGLVSALSRAGPSRLSSSTETRMGEVVATQWDAMDF